MLTLSVKCDHEKCQNSKTLTGKKVSASVLKKAAKEIGWKWSGGKHLCPEHNVKKDKKEKVKKMSHTAKVNAAREKRATPAPKPKPAPNLAPEEGRAE